MFGRAAGGAGGGGGQSLAAPPGLGPQRDSDGDVDGAAIGMSPIGLAPPSGTDQSLPVPAAQQATAQAQAGATSASIHNRPKPLSYASAAATAAAAAATSGQPKVAPTSIAGPSPSSSTSAFQPQRVYGAPPAGLSSTRSGLAASRAGVPSSGEAHSHGAASFQQQQTGQAQSHSQMQTHAQAPAQAYTPTHPSPLVARSPSQQQQQPHQTPPALVHQSYSYSAALPSRSSLLNNTRPAASSTTAGAATLASLGLSSPPVSVNGPPGFATSPSYSVSTSIPRASAFGTSPFGNNAIFLSSSYDEKDDAANGSGTGMTARGARSSFSAATGARSGSGREASPHRAGFASGSRSYGAAARNGYGFGGGSEMHGDDGADNGNDDDVDHEDDGDDDGVLQGEELVPSSLKHLLTPDERARKDSRSGGRSGFFNPFDDVDGQEDDNDDGDDLGLGLGDGDEAHLQHRYSKSVPAAIHFRQQQKGMASLASYNKAPGSPPTFLSSYSSNNGSSGNLPAGMAPLQSPSSASLAKHLLSGAGHALAHSPSGPRIERGFYSSSYAPPLLAGGSGISSLANENRGSSASGLLGPSTLTSSGAGAGAGQAAARPSLSGANLGTSLPQGLAAGLSRLHLVAAGTERTGYTPPASYAQSPPGHLSFGLGASRPAFASSLTSPASTSGAPGGVGGAVAQAGNGSGGGYSSSPSMSHFPASPPSVNGLNPAASAFTGGSSRPSSSFRLPTLSTLPPASHAPPHPPPSVARRISGHGGVGGQDGGGPGTGIGAGTGTAPIVGSPLARTDVQHGFYPQQQHQQQSQRQQTRPGAGGKAGAHSRTSDADAGPREDEEGHGEEDEMVFEMDV